VDVVPYLVARRRPVRILQLLAARASVVGLSSPGEVEDTRRYYATG
jgi:hypothetical protein